MFCSSRESINTLRFWLCGKFLLLFSRHVCSSFSQLAHLYRMFFGHCYSVASVINSLVSLLFDALIFRTNRWFSKDQHEKHATYFSHPLFGYVRHIMFFFPLACSLCKTFYIDRFYQCQLMWIDFEINTRKKTDSQISRILLSFFLASVLFWSCASNRFEVKRITDETYITYCMQ